MLVGNLSPLTKTAASVCNPRTANILVPFLIFVAISLPITIFQLADYSDALARGAVIPDSLNDGITFDNLRADGIPLYASSVPGLGVLYGFLWDYYPQLCFFINAALILAALRVSQALFATQLGFGRVASASILFNPYIYLAASGPNKEIPLILLTLAYAYLLVARPRYYRMVALGIAVCAYFFRDGYGAFLALFLIGHELLRRRTVLIVQLVAVASLASSGLFFVLRTFIPIMDRNYKVGSTIDFASGALAMALGLDPNTFVGGLGLFFVRLAQNFLSGALLPVLASDQGAAYFAGIMYWFEGLLVLVTLPVCALVLIRRNQARGDVLLAGISVSTLFMISVSTFVQPRYLIPILPLTIAIFAEQPRYLRWRVLQLGIGLTVAILYAYYLLGRSTLLQPMPEGQTAQPPGYLSIN